MHEVNARHQVEQLSGEMLSGRRTRRSEIDGAGFRSRDFDQILHRSGGESRVNDPHVWRQGELRDRREVAYRVERNLRVKAWARDEVRRSEQHRITVGQRMSYDL